MVMQEADGKCRNLVAKHERKKLPGHPGVNWGGGDNIKIDLKGTWVRLWTGFNLVRIGFCNKQEGNFFVG
jgi:hypothetical protein